MLNPEILRRFSFFAALSNDQLQDIAESAPRASLTANTQVFQQGDLSATMYLILKGGVKIERNDDNGQQVNLGELTENQVFGELAMLGNEPRQATVTTTSDSEFLVIDRSMMLRIIGKANPEEILHIFSVLSRQIRALNEEDFRELLKIRTMEAQMEVEKQRGLTQLVAGVAHEINTPLGVINTAVSIIARELASPEEITTQRAADIAESLDLMRRNVERAHKLIQDFKKVSISQLNDEKDNFDISEALRETIDLITVSLKRHQIAVKFDDQLAPDQKAWFGYRGFLSQILINLLTNVERYAYPNGKGGIAEVTVTLQNENYLLTVCDFGVGISERDQLRIFEPFFTTGRSIGGTGLGLAIVHNLATNALKGEIRLKSKEGSGTEFTISFPRKIPD